MSDIDCRTGEVGWEEIGRDEKVRRSVVGEFKVG